MYQKLASYIKDLEPELISDERKTVLRPLVNYIHKKQEAAQAIQLTFICTHNSRRSHLGQVWAKVAATYLGIQHVKTFSGGTEATACNYRTIAAFNRAGFEIKAEAESENPVYEIKYAEESDALMAFSKVYDQTPNPTKGFAAIMTCDHADENCPFIPGAEARLPILYVDPKVSDDTPEEATTYDKRCKQIAEEMFWAFGQQKD